VAVDARDSEMERVTGGRLSLAKAPGMGAGMCVSRRVGAARGVGAELVAGGGWAESANWIRRPWSERAT
jgi:hypothetical protein